MLLPEKLLKRFTHFSICQYTYQPILSVATGRFESAEALVRMKDETGAYISPGRFIPAAERS
ncbi:MAG: EAL domain-containing protein, partial [Lachnospiraceae bacterium]|nr:EAL domain-containing protein [Lachnospiraceae bacterium]